MEQHAQNTPMWQLCCQYACFCLCSNYTCKPENPQCVEGSIKYLYWVMLSTGYFANPTGWAVLGTCFFSPPLSIRCYFFPRSPVAVLKKLPLLPFSPPFFFDVKRWIFTNHLMRSKDPVKRGWHVDTKRTKGQSFGGSFQTICQDFLAFGKHSQDRTPASLTLTANWINKPSIYPPPAHC